MLDDLANGRRVRWSAYGSVSNTGKIPKSERSRSHLRHYNFDDDPQGPYFVPNVLHSSDDLEDISNVRVFKEQFGQLLHREWWELGGGEFIFRIDADERHEELGEFLQGLENYPIADEEDHSNLEMETENENWSDYGEREFRDEVMGYVPEAFANQAESIFTSHWYDLWRVLSEVTNQYVSHEEGSTHFPIGEVVWQSIAKMTEDEWSKFIELVAKDTGWDYRGAIYGFVKALHDRKLSPDEIAALAWGYGLEQFRNGRDGLVSQFAEYWRGERYIPNPNPPPTSIRSPVLTVEQQAHLQGVWSNLKELSDEALTVLFWKVLRPAWDANHPEHQQAFNSRWDHPPHFNFHWMTYHFAAHALDTDFLVMLDMLTEGSFEHAPAFVPLVTLWFAQQR